MPRGAFLTSASAAWRVPERQAGHVRVIVHGPHDGSRHGFDAEGFLFALSFRKSWRQLLQQAVLGHHRVEKSEQFLLRPGV